VRLSRIAFIRASLPVDRPLANAGRECHFLPMILRNEIGLG
jgi:hypothetical protein